MGYSYAQIRNNLPDEDRERCDADEAARSRFMENYNIGVQEERARWQQIYTSREFADREEAARHLLENADLSDQQILGLLKTMPLTDRPQAIPTLAERMAKESIPLVGLAPIHEESDDNLTGKIIHSYEQFKGGSQDNDQEASRILQAYKADKENNPAGNNGSPSDQ